MIEPIRSIALEAGELAMQFFRRSDTLPLESKGHLDLVTAADRAVEQLLVDRLRTAFPDDGILGEEGASAGTRSGRIWVIDPIDGTFNFVRGSDQWSVSIGLFDGKKPLFGAVNLPVQQRLFLGGATLAPQCNGVDLKPLPHFDRQRAVVALGFGPASTDNRSAELVSEIVRAGMAFRHGGSGSVSLLGVALGEVDGYVSLAESSWDVMAALAILEAMGAQHSLHWAGQSLDSKFPLLCGTPGFFVALHGLDLTATTAAQPGSV